MEFLLTFLLFLFSALSLGVSHADQTISPEMYWKRVLPNSSMPRAITDSLSSDAEWMENKGTAVSVGKGGVGVHTSKHGGRTDVGVGKGGVGVHTTKPYGGRTDVGVGKGGVGVHTTKPHGGRTDVGVGKGGVGVQTGKPGHPGTHVGVSKGGVVVTTGPKHKHVYVGVHPGPNPFQYNYAATETQLHQDPNVALFFLHKNLNPGNKMTLHFPRSTDHVSTFLPRHVASTIPFSSSQFPTILRRFAVSPNSDEAAVMKQTIKTCEQNGAVSGEKKYCATSLESMVDFAKSSFPGSGVKAVSTDASIDDGRKKEFTVTAVSDVGGGVVACHKEKYPYAVFFCHKTAQTAAYTVELAAEGKTVTATAVCHSDTSKWNPKHLAFQVLKVKPGSVPVCHFLPEDHVVWARN